MKQIVLLLGAGATVADVACESKSIRPPLDREFFKLAQRAGYEAVSKVADYMLEEYSIDIFEEKKDSLESVMMHIYTELFSKGRAEQAKELFFVLLELFNERLAKTTNDAESHWWRAFYRIICHYLETPEIRSEDLTIITFNQDIQAEKTLDLLQRTERWEKKTPFIAFPECYGLEPTPSLLPNSSSGPRFDSASGKLGTIRVLKLHGSANWFSSHRDRYPSTENLFKPDRKIYVSDDQQLRTDLVLYTKAVRSWYLWPIVIPPVSQKSAIFHQSIVDLWNQAEQALNTADEVLIFGYSCPELDHESCSMLERALRGNKKARRIIIIDPNSDVLKHYVDMLEPPQIDYYSSAKQFLKK